MDWTPEAITAAIGAVTALVVAVTGVIRELRFMRRDIVDAVERHMSETISAIQKGQI